MHIDRIQSTTMVEHHVVAHSVAVSGCHHLSVIGRINSRALGCREIHAVVELFDSQCRMDTVAVIIRDPGIGCQRELKGTAIVSQHSTTGLQDLFFLCGNGSLQGCNLRILIRNGLLVFLDGLFLVGNIGFVSGDIPVLLVDQSLHIGLLLFHAGLGLIQNGFLRFQFLFAEFNIFAVLHEVFPLLSVISHDQIHEIRTVQEITEAFCFQHHIEDVGIPFLIHNSYAADHGIFLIFFSLQCRIQFRLGLCNFFFFCCDLIFQIRNILFDLAQILIQLGYIIFQIGLLCLQVFLDLLQIAQIAFHLFTFFFRLFDLILFVPDTVRGNG